MLPLMLLIHLFLGATVAGSAVIVALVLGFDTAVPIAGAAIAGFVVSMPLSWSIAKRLNG